MEDNKEEKTNKHLGTGYTSVEDLLAGMRSRWTWWDHLMCCTWWPLRRFIVAIPSQTKWWFQRKLHGFDDREIWNLGWAVVRFTYPRLKVFVEGERMGIPGNVSSAKEWDDILHKMLRAFELYIRDENCEIDYDKEDYVKITEEIHEGMMLFGKWIGHLWD